MADPIARRGKWYQWDDQKKEWLEWNEEKKQWENRSSPPPPTDEPKLWEREWLKPLIPLVVGALLTAAILTPLGRWIQERGKAADLKSTIITQLTEGATDTVSAGRVLTFDLLPEQQQERVLEERFRRVQEKSKDGPKSRLRKLRKELRKAREAAFVAEATRFGQARENWLRVSASTRSKFKTYFQNGQSQPILDEWSELSMRVLGYLRLGVSLVVQSREFEVQQLQRYLEGSLGDSEDSIDWQLLQEDPRSYDAVDFGKASDDYERIGRLLTKRVDSMVGNVVEADSTVYMESWFDWWD